MAIPLPNQISFRLGAKMLLRGAVCRRVLPADRGGEEMIETLTRADATTCATFADRDGILRTALANILRVEWVDLDGDGIRETPGVLIESSRTNSCLRSEALDDAAWTADGTTVTANAAAAPD